jgi:tRNA nucleotidyltransferase (CCA-adding enzyme)
MDIILTHEQADFDALAAMLAASLLAEESQPVLPNRVNRNVRKFINLYGAELPFVDARDLPAENIQQVTLVDTQSLVTLKGIHKNTQIHVVDHHQAKPDLSADWICKLEKLGATTTILVEMLMDRDVQLSNIQATLLLLGIYEDTGSLTYAGTTVRDVKAVVFLLEKGASLRIAAEYLNPALTVNQRALAEDLMQNATTLPILGKNILLSSADAATMDEEISSVAHKLRDLLDPDALFLIVQTKEGTRIIARSTSDEINVSRILIPFGGGGHERAASALLTRSNLAHENTLQEITNKLTEEIKKNIRPPLTVHKIMSKKPLLLTPETTIAEADLLMQRYGYEGYPVVQEDKVVGLLTRRAVDRARNHKLKISVGSLMESGSYSLSPNQSLDQVQEMMASTGWGQIPVLDPETNKILGIVTRTDLLKNLTYKDSNNLSAVKYADLIEKALPACRLALLRQIIELSQQDRQALYIVGGFVRDLLLNIPSQDFDIVVEGDAIRLARLLSDKFGGKVTVHRRFGTAKWQIKDIHASLKTHLGCTPDDSSDLPEALDLISARTEFYDHPTALPIVVNSSIKQDLHRRDFTINTLALRLDGSHFGELQDYWGGLDDLKKKQVKVLHSLSFVDDPTRMLRAVRFEQRFGFNIEVRTLQLMQEARENLKQISGDRIRHEFNLIFLEADACKVLKRLMELNLLTAVHPTLEWKEDWSVALQKALTGSPAIPWNLTTQASLGDLKIASAYLVWLSNLSVESALAVANRLHFSNPMVASLKASLSLVKNIDDLGSMPPSQFTESVQNLPEIALYTLDCLQENQLIKQQIHNYLTKWRGLEPFTTGETLKAKGIPPGPRYTAILKELKHAKLDGKISSQQQELIYLDQLIQEL